MLWIIMKTNLESHTSETNSIEEHDNRATNGWQTTITPILGEIKSALGTIPCPIQSPDSIGLPDHIFPIDHHVRIEVARVAVAVGLWGAGHGFVGFVGIRHFGIFNSTCVFLKKVWLWINAFFILDFFCFILCVYAIMNDIYENISGVFN